MIIDGIVDTVMMDQDAVDADVDVEIIDFDKNTGNKELLDELYEIEGMKDAPFSIKHLNREHIVDDDENFV